MQHLVGLNERQKKAVMCLNGPLLIVAGAGAGKTKTITHRIANLIDSGVSPGNVLAVTFTNKAAKEMFERVENLIDFHNFKEKPTICTFHALGVRILKENAGKIGLSRFFTILDESDSISLIKESMKELGIEVKTIAPKTIKNVISRHKNNYLSDEDFQINSYSGQMYLAVWRLYEQKKKKEGALDFDDLLFETVKLLEGNKEILDYYQEKFKYIHVDEYQDTNKVQYLLVKLLASKYKNICVVGDGDQNIYSWRGADIINILNFEEDYKDAEVVFLEENYRSTKNIIAVANEVIKKNNQRKEKNLFTKNKDGELISIYEAYNDKYEAEFLADKIVELLDKGVCANDIAILYRANFQSRVIEEMMLKYGIPYQVLGVKFFDRKEVKDVLSYLRVSLNRESFSDFKRACSFPKRGIGASTIEKIISGKKEELSQSSLSKINNFNLLLDKIRDFVQINKPSEVIKFIIKESGIENELKNSKDETDHERLENVLEIVTFATKYDSFDGVEGIEMLLEESALASDQDSLGQKKTKEERNGVKLMTIHASKGLEFEYVFIVGLENDLFPHTSDQSTESDLEEERRLFYVAITRAKEKLFLSYATIRMIFGETRVQSPSMFLSDVPEEFILREEREFSGFGNNVIYLD